MEAVVQLLRSPSKPLSDGLLRNNGNNDSSWPHSIQKPVTNISRGDEVEIVLMKSRKMTTQRATCRNFPFLDIAPEIRNCVYRILLTTPGKPIEFPGPKALDERERAAKSRKSSKAKNKIAHKRMLLEILRSCRQVHDEATGIMYGCNVFKYRNDFREGGARITMLPTCHLQLLKHIKVTVISGDPPNRQEERIADLISRFTTDGILLDTFELTWYGWQRYVLEWNGPVCQKLLSLKVAKQLTMHVNGEARIRKTTKSKLQETICCRQVEVHRPNERIPWQELGYGADVDFY